MNIQIRLAGSSLELDRLFRARHLAMVGVREAQDGMSVPFMHDRYDAYPGTANIIAARGERIVGGVRFSNMANTGLPPEDFPGVLIPSQARVGILGMFFTSEPQREGYFLQQSMLSLGFQWAVAQGLTHLFAVLDARSRDPLLAAGFTEIRPTLQNGMGAERRTLARIDLEDLDARYLRFNRDEDSEFMFSFVRDYYEAGDTIVRQGELGTSCYLIGAGRVAVEVTPPGAGQPHQVAELGPGQFFGELALLTNRPRSASVVALTDVDLIALSRSAFNELVRTDSAIAVRLLELLGERLAVTVEYLASVVVSSTANGTSDTGDGGWTGGERFSWY